MRIGTQSGIIRYDGKTSEPFQPGRGHELLSGFIFSLFGTADGGVRIGDESGISKLQGGQLINSRQRLGRLNALPLQGDLRSSKDRPFGRSGRCKFHIH